MATMTRTLALVLLSASLVACTAPDEVSSTQSNMLAGETPATTEPSAVAIKPPFANGTFVGKQIGTLDHGGDVEPVENAVRLVVTTSGPEVTIAGQFDTGSTHATTVDTLRFSTSRFFELVAPDGAVSGYGACVDAACVVEIARGELSGTLRYQFDQQGLSITSELRLPGMIQRTTGRLQRQE